MFFWVVSRILGSNFSEFLGGFFDENKRFWRFIKTEQHFIKFAFTNHIFLGSQISYEIHCFKVQNDFLEYFHIFFSFPENLVYNKLKAECDKFFQINLFSQKMPFYGLILYLFFFLDSSSTLISPLKALVLYFFKNHDSQILTFCHKIMIHNN